MLFLLPPSEGKAAPAVRGRPLDLAALSFPELTATRARIIDALVELCAGDEEVARATLGLSPGLAPEIARNAAIRRSPARPAADVYTGVIYDNLDLHSLPADARRRAARSVVVFSALWGLLRPADRIPGYRLAPGVNLSGIGPLPSLWREPVSGALDSAVGRQLVVDLRSGSYAAMWHPAGEAAERSVEVRVLQERRPGDPSSRIVVSHFNKATKGRLVRALLLSGESPRRPADFVRLVRALGYTAEHADEGARKAGRPHRVDLVVTDL